MEKPKINDLNRDYNKGRSDMEAYHNYVMERVSDEKKLYDVIDYELSPFECSENVDMDSWKKGLTTAISEHIKKVGKGDINE